MVGQTVSHYRIVEKLGGGGMGVVYKAIDTRLNRFVALKFLSPTLTKDAEANERFMQEAQAASALDHPNICTIHEIDETPDRELFLTMVYYDGETLKQRIERGPLSIEDTLDIAIQMTRALAKAHDAGIVHRDVKPANLIIAKDGLVKILDFGLAKLAGHADLTRTGTTLGTIAYMSPEQVRGMDVDARADVWAHGVVLYEMLAGRRPFEGKDDLTVLTSIANDTPKSITSVRSDVPAGVPQILSRSMDRTLASRYSSATELLKDLTACRSAMTESAPRGVDVWRLLRRPVVAIPALAVLIAVSVAATMAYRRASRARWAREDVIPQITRFIDADNSAAAFALATEIERDIPNDPVLAGLWQQFSAIGAITTTEPGATIYVQPYASTDNQWKLLGRTPITGVRLPHGAFRFRVEKEGFETQTLATTNPGILLQNVKNRLAKPLDISLVPTGTTRGMVRVPGGTFPISLNRFSSNQLVSLDPFSIDRYEVTNQAFKRFVDGGGYAKHEYWRDLSFIKDGRTVDWDEAVKQFKDSSDRFGPAAWEIGQFPSGQDHHPVGGVSWYEAVAYCRSESKTLPTLYHWSRAALSPDETFSPLAPAIIPLSNFSGRGVAPVGTFRGTDRTAHLTWRAT